MIAVWFTAALGAGFTLEALPEKPPAEIAEPLRKTLPEQGWRLLDEEKKPLLDLWLRKEVPLYKGEGEAPSNVKFASIQEGSFFGAVRYHRKHVDFRDFTIPKGTFTLRYGIQPVDGNHLGVSDTRDFLMLCPSKEDATLDPIPTKGLEKLSVKVSGTKHPSVLYLFPGTEKRGSLPSLSHDEEKDWWVLDCRIPFAEEKEKAAELRLVLSGFAPNL